MADALARGAFPNHVGLLPAEVTTLAAGRRDCEVGVWCRRTLLPRTWGRSVRCDPCAVSAPYRTCC